MKIYYNKKTKLFAGAKNISSNQLLKNVDYLEIEEKEWLNFLEKNNGQQIKIENGQLIAQKFEPTLEQKKNQGISARKSYLKSTFEHWFDDVENMPQEIKNKRRLARQEISEIEQATEKTINNYSMEF